MKNLITCLVFLLATLSANASEADRAEANFSFEVVECMTYYALVANHLKKQRPDANTADYLTAITRLLALAKQFNSKEGISARAEMIANDMMESIDNNWNNGAVLINKYNDTCASITKDPAQRFKYWYKKETGVDLD